MRQQMQYIVSALPQKIIDLLLEKIRIEGVQPVTLESIQALIMSILTSENSPLQMMRSEIRTISERIGTPRDNEQHGHATRERDSTVRSQTGYTHRWRPTQKKSTWSLKDLGGLMERILGQCGICCFLVMILIRLFRTDE
jgi:hypothetical protein